jgi:cobalt-zinc-cadmium efflux system protein
VAQVLMTRPAAGRRTFGLRRAEALGAQANGLLVVGVTIWIVIEAIQRLGHSQSVDGAGLLAVATVGLVVNAAVTVVLARVAGTNLNLRAARVHMLSDVAGSAGAMVAGIGILAFGATWLDPAASLAIAVLVAWSAWGVLRDTTNVFLEAAPRGVDVDQVEQALFHEAGVEAVHHLHVWEVASDLPALSAHVVLGDVPSLHDAQVRGDELKTMLADRFGITHTTLELECHVCDDPAH